MVIARCSLAMSSLLSLGIVFSYARLEIDNKRIQKGLGEEPQVLFVYHNSFIIYWAVRIVMSKGSQHGEG